jgi:rare lipoprotein A
MLNKLSISFIFVVLILLNACSSQTTGRYQQKHDSIPVRLPTLTERENPIPRIEQPSRGGNKDYSVRGKFYQVMESADHFKQKGIASWYGNKFHGHLTSNGEIYDMYSMSAAHKSLPLPTYVKVTNLTNHKSVIVRVNDRGPFHENRIIDLSYSAAYQLGMLKTGTAKVEIEAITKKNIAQILNPSKQDLNSDKDQIATDIASTPLPPPVNAQPTLNKNNITDENKKTYIQVFATRNEVLAKNTASGLSLLYQIPAVFPLISGIYKVQLGPINDTETVVSLLSTLKQNGYPNAYQITL